MTCRCHCEMYGPITMGGPCHECGYTHPGETCEEHKVKHDAAVQRIVDHLCSMGAQMASFHMQLAPSLSTSGVLNGILEDYEETK
jgi:hypothetical protein